MLTSGVSFGKVIAVSGNPKKMMIVNKKLYPYTQNGTVMIKDVTSFYKNVPPHGELALAAQNGEIVDLYITREDVLNVKNKKDGWKSIQDILVNLEDSFSANKMFLNEVISRIVRK